MCFGHYNNMRRWHCSETYGAVERNRTTSLSMLSTDNIGTKAPDESEWFEATSRSMTHVGQYPSSKSFEAGRQQWNYPPKQHGRHSSHSRDRNGTLPLHHMHTTVVEVFAIASVHPHVLPVRKCDSKEEEEMPQQGSKVPSVPPKRRGRPRKPTMQISGHHQDDCFVTLCNHRH